MKSQPPGFFVFSLEAFSHDMRPQSSGRPEFGDLLKELVMRIEKERNLRCKVVYVQPGLDCRLHISDPVRQCKRDLLRCCATCLPNMVAADADRVPARHI